LQVTVISFYDKCVDQPTNNLQTTRKRKFRFAKCDKFSTMFLHRRWLQKLLGLAKSQQSVKTSFGKVVCELKATELDFPSSVPKTGL
jgi:hypothetical protein